MNTANTSVKSKIKINEKEKEKEKQDQVPNRTSTPQIAKENKNGSSPAAEKENEGDYKQYIENQE